MERHSELDWSAVTRQAIQEKIEALEVLDELTERGRERVDDESTSREE